MNDIFKNLLISISNGGDRTGGGAKLTAKNQNSYSEEVERNIEEEHGGGGNDPIENTSKPNSNL